jgi:hypothetical protein
VASDEAAAAVHLDDSRCRSPHFLRVLSRVSSVCFGSCHSEWLCDLWELSDEGPMRLVVLVT